MNFAQAVKGCSRRSSKLQSINSAAETELGRRLTQDEILSLSNKFSVELIHNHVEKRPELKCFSSTNPTPRDGNCLFHALIDGIENNEAFRHTQNEKKQESWTQLLQDLRFTEEMNEDEHIQYLRNRFVIGASEWLAGNCGSKENNKSSLGYSDSEWDWIWTTMLEDGAWAVPSIKDMHGNTLKENFAPEMLIKFAAHELKCNIIVLDLVLDTFQFCSGNHLKNNNVVFDSPLVLYSTGSHFQAVFQTDHEFFITFAHEFQSANNNVEATSASKSIPKRKMPMEENQSKKTKSPEAESIDINAEKVPSCVLTPEVEKRIEEIKKIKVKDRSPDVVKEYNRLREKRRLATVSVEAENTREKQKERSQNTQETLKMRKVDNLPSCIVAEIEARLKEIKKIKVKDRSPDIVREYNQLREKKRFATMSEEAASKTREKQKARKQNTRENQKIKEEENEKEKVRKQMLREDKKFKQAENEKEKVRKQKLREDKKVKQAENEKEKVRKQKLRVDKENRKIENEKLKVNRKEKALKERDPLFLLAANKDQAEFRENDFPGQLLSSSIGSLFEEKNQCGFCKAFRFKGERNFCCGKGKVKVALLPDAPNEMQKLYSDKKFLKDARGYNNILAMASVGCATPDQFKGPNFKIQGKLYHAIGSLIPNDQSKPKFLQLYFYDTDEATDHRLDLMPRLCPNILKQLTDILQISNSYVKSFKAAYECVNEEDELKIILLGDKKKIPSGQHTRKYNLPQGSEVAALMPGEGDGELEVVVRDKENHLRTISTLHRSYDPLSYVLIDPYGTDGYHTGIGKKEGSQRNISIAEFYSYRIQVRPGFNQLLKSRRCFQQYLVDQAAKIENARMKWVLDNQKTIKAEKYNGLLDAAAVGDLVQVGRKIILPPTITGSPRFYVEKFQDAMAIVRKFGKPTLFITMTCNPEWPEITESLSPGESAFDRPDLVTRVFKMKNDMLINDIVKNQIFGRVIAYVGTQEQQKRKGLHHTHTLITLEAVPRNPEDVDRMISAEIPDKTLNPELFKIIVKNNIHGPCGAVNKQSPCMEVDDRGRLFCTKEFPKAFQDETSLTEFTYPKYRRRSPENGGNTAIKMLKGKEIVVDNSTVVPYNSFLSLKFDGHINLEFLESVVAVKYVYKYITKGPDRCIMSKKISDGSEVVGEQQVNEVEQFVDARYLGASESAMKIFRFPVHYRSHSVEKLPCHLPGEQSILFEEGQAENILNAGPPETKLTRFFQTNIEEESARDLLYTEFPGHFGWKAGEWKRKKRNIGEAIGRIPTVTLCSKQMETYALRLLLHHVRGPLCFEDLRTVNGELLNTYQEACQKLGLMEDDSEVQQALAEACSIRFGDQLISFFGSLLEFCRPGNPFALWEKFKKELTYHILHTSTSSPDEAESIVLEKLKDQLNRSGSDLKSFNLPEPSFCGNDNTPKVISSETNYDKEKLLKAGKQNVERMTDEQITFFESVLDSINSGNGGIFCLNAAGGTGKTFTLNTLLDCIRGDGFVALATASSGVASKLLHNGTTVHSRFKVPINVNSTSTCNFSSSDATGKLIKMAKLIIMDEMTMLHRHIYEALDRSLRDTTGKDEPFGGITTVFAGDWRQCLPIVQRGSRGDVVHACLKCSHLWKLVKVTNLTRNMRVELNGESSEFAKLLLNIGDGILPENKTVGESMVELPTQLFIKTSSASELVEEVFPEFKNNFSDTTWIKNRAILCPTNQECSEINKLLLEKLPGISTVYKSCDMVNQSESHMFPTEFLNTIELQGIPPHSLELKPGSVIILLRNLNPSEGHVNGTRYVVQNLLPHVIDAISISGSNVGSKIFIPRIWLISKDATLPFEMRRKQFPVKLAYSMTANKAQGQTLAYVGIYIAREFFSHGQFYVAMSRVGKMDSVKILFKKENNYHVRNIVYHEVL